MEHPFFKIGNRVYALDEIRRGVITNIEFYATPSPYADLWYVYVLWDDGSTQRLYDDHVRKLTPLELLAEI